MRHIALIYQEQMRVEHYRKSDLGWELEALLRQDDVLSFEAVGFQIPLARVYFGFDAVIAARRE